MGPDQQLAHKLNRIAHNLAYTFLRKPHPSFTLSTKVIAPPTEQVLLEYENSMITSKLAVVVLKQELHTELLIATICKEAKWTRSIFHSVDWEAYSKAFHKLPRGKQITYIKLTHGITNTNVKNSRFYNLSDRCLCCNLTHEMIPHLLTCQEETTKENRRNAQTKLFDKLQQLQTPECLLTCIQHALEHWE